MLLKYPSFGAPPLKNIEIFLFIYFSVRRILSKGQNILKFIKIIEYVNFVYINFVYIMLSLNLNISEINVKMI